MTATLRAALLTALAFAIIPAVAAGQDTSTASLLRRIELLERANTDLERRVGELESLIKSGPSPGQPLPASTKWHDLANWRRLRRGMKMDEVRTLLGEPNRVQAGFVTNWYWAETELYAKVSFMNDKLDGWTEPVARQ